MSLMKVSTTTGESIRALVSRLLAKRGLRLTSFDVFSSKVITDHGHGHNHVDVDVDEGDGDQLWKEMRYLLSVVVTF